MLVVISGPSGVGKGTLAKKLVNDNKDMFLSVSCTTREPREGETDKESYFFISKSQFEKKIAEGDFLEYSDHFGNYYGTPKSFVLDKMKSHDVILEIDVDGGLNVKKNYKDTLLILVVPPSIDELINRLDKRHSETEEQIKTRLERVNYELDKKDLYDYTIVNDNFDECLNQIEKIIKIEKQKF